MAGNADIDSNRAQKSTEQRRSEEARKFLAKSARAFDGQRSKKYVALVEAIENGIESGALAAGAQLPPQREIAEFFDVTVATVTKAIGEAARRGLVVARSGSGTYVAGPNTTATDTAPAVVDLSLNAPPAYITASIVRDALKVVADEQEPAELFDYAAIPGRAANRRAGTAWLALRGLDMDPERIAITQGAHEGLIVALLTLTRPGDAVLCERVNYAGLRRIGRLLQLRLIGIEVDREGMDTSGLDETIRRHDAKAIVCTPACHNPTSAMLSAARRRQLVAAAKAAEVPIIEDDIYGLLCGEGFPPLLPLWPEGIVLVTSLSKTVAPGLRLGYVAFPAQLGPRIRDAMFMLGWTEPSLQAAVATRLIVSGDAEHCAGLHRAESSRRVALVQRLLGGLVMSEPGAASYHLWVSTGKLRPGEIAAELSRRGILVSSSSHFIVDDSPSPHAIRLSLGSNTPPEALKRALHVVADVLASDRASSLGSIV